MTKKMKEKVKQHGSTWNLVSVVVAPLTKIEDAITWPRTEAMIETLMPVHSGKYPYAVRGVIGVDFNLSIES